MNTALMALQPYIELQSDHYNRIEKMEMGISHFYAFDIRHPEHSKIDAVPDGSIDLLFCVGKNKVQTYLSGTVFSAKPWEMGEEESYFGVRFQPGAGVLPKSISIEEIINEDVKIDGNLFGDGLEERIAEASDIESRSEIFLEVYSKLLMRQMKEDTGRSIERYLTKRICTSRGQISMKELTEETGYSAAYIRRVFRKYHGISPKQFSQYIRFQNLLCEQRHSQKRFDELALNCGYYDEAHMMKEFKKYVGLTLEQFRQLTEGVW